MTQEDVADGLDVEKSTIGKWERGISKPTPEFLVSLARFFSVSIDDLLLADLSKGETLQPEPKSQNPPADIVSLLARLNRQLDEAEAQLAASRDPHVAKRLVELRDRIRDRFPDQADELLQ